MSNTFSWPIYSTILGATTLGQSGPGNDDNEGVLHILQSSSITDCLMSYSRHSLRGDLPLYRDAAGVFYTPIRLNKKIVVDVG